LVRSPPTFPDSWRIQECCPLELVFGHGLGLDGESHVPGTAQEMVPDWSYQRIVNDLVNQVAAVLGDVQQRGEQGLAQAVASDAGAIVVGYVDWDY
jgi:hypothetical protein